MLIIENAPMRTLPKSLATFRKIVNQRDERLRKLTQEKLKTLAAEPAEQTIRHVRRPFIPSFNLGQMAPSELSSKGL